MNLRSALVTSVLLVTAIGCGDDEPSTPDPGPTAPATTTTTTAAPPVTTETAPTTTAAATELAEVTVYWAWAIPTTPGGSPERIAGAARSVDSGDPMVQALRIVLGGGPDEIEQSIGMTTQAPIGTVLLGLEVGNGHATVDLSRQFETSGGTLGETLRIAQVVFTLTQFDGVDRVFFRIEGEDRSELGSHGLDVSNGLTRTDMENVRPAILIESVGPGAPTPASFVVRGEANTFEATLNYRVTDERAAVLDQGFTTATSGTGTWGPFEFSVDLPEGTDGAVDLTVYELSAADGSEINVVTYPLMIE